MSSSDNSDNENGEVLTFEYTESNNESGIYKDHKVSYKNDIYEILFKKRHDMEVYQNGDLIVKDKSYSAYPYSNINLRYLKNSQPVYKQAFLAVEKIHENIIPLILLSPLPGIIGVCGE